MYNYVLNHDHKFWTTLVIKDIQKSRSNIKIKIQSHIIKSMFEKFNTCGPFYKVYWRL
jgi:hypothetical protein